MFDPFKDARTFQVAIGDTATAVMSLQLIERLAANAGENVHIALSMSHQQRIAVQMEEGEISFVIDAERIAHGGVNRRVLIEQPFVMAQRKGHPRGIGALELDAHCGLRHIVASVERGIVRGYMDEHVETLGRQRNTVLSVPQVLMLPEILRMSDYVCTPPRMLLSRFSEIVDVFELPFRAERFTLTMAWYPRNNADPAVK